MKAAGAAVVAIVVMLTCCASAALAAGELEGTVTLRGGQTLSGKIQLAELGVVEGAGIGNSLPGHGAFIIKVGDKTERIPGDEVAIVEVEWANTGSDANPHWEIKKLTIVKKDGTKVTGAPDWLLHATNVWVITAGGETKRVSVFPFGNEPFNADNLIAKISIGQAPTGPAPTTQPPAEAKPATEIKPPVTTTQPKPGTAKPEAAKPAPETKPAEAKPAETKPTETKPATQPAQPAKPQPTTAKPAAGKPTPTLGGPQQPAPTGTKPGGVTAGPVLAKDVMILMVRCPRCGELIKIIIAADAVRVEHVEAEK